MKHALWRMGYTFILGACLGVNVAASYFFKAQVAALSRRVDEACGAQVSSVAQAKPEPCPISIFVGPGLDVTVTIPRFDKASLVGVYSEFFGHGPGTEDAHQQAEMRAVFSRAKQLTLIVTTKCPHQRVPSAAPKERLD